MKLLAATLLLTVTGLAGCATPPPPQPTYQVAPPLEPGAEYPHARIPPNGQPAS